MYTISNEVLSVTISAEGAEPYSIKQGDLERLWQADPAVWGKHAPLLFPLIGRLRNGSYLLNGEEVAAPKHGFCRERAFQATQVSPTCVRFDTQQDDETRAVYPFDFTLQVEYALEGNTLVKTHRITNTGAEPMPFELGGHEAYATCLLPGETHTDYFVQFEGLTQLEGFDMDETGALMLPKRVFALEDGRLTQTPEQLEIDTVVLENVPNSRVTLGCTKNDHTVTVEFEDFPYFGIWSMPAGDNTRYLCLEPWSALPDGHFASRELAEKPGVITLQPGETCELTYRMTFR